MKMTNKRIVICDNVQFEMGRTWGSSLRTPCLLMTWLKKKWVKIFVRNHMIILIVCESVNVYNSQCLDLILSAPPKINSENSVDET